ncbi:MAG: hypothetical protein ACREUZ_02480, partial [Burkholderiales bacterium]
MNHRRLLEPNVMSRRKWIQALAIGGAGVALAPPIPVRAWQTPRTPEPVLTPINRFPRMVQEFFVDRENRIHHERLKRLAALTTKADAEAYVQTVRTKIRQCFGPSPAKTPLNPRVTRVVERDAYKIENVLFESRPGFLVSANLY